MCSSTRRASCCVLAVLLFAVGCRPEQPAASGPAATPQDPPDSTDLPLPLLTDTELAEGWISLFDGVSLYGWENTSDANWRVENGAIVVDSGEQGLLCTTTQFSDYLLRLEFNSDPDTNSGVFLRTELVPGDVSQDCYELNIAPADNPFPTGGLVQRSKASSDLNRDGWQAYQVYVVGDRIRVVLDDADVLDYQDPHPIKRGRIGLQRNAGRVAFRNIKLKPLGLKDLFNGVDLTGWKSYPDMTSRFSVSGDGTLDVRDGPGQLETSELYGDFVLQLQAQVNAPGLNSGIFFRCIPGDTMMGYESQIHNGMVGGDRSQPSDHGTGGIFNRQEARLVVAGDLVWFHKTLVADGPHMAAWVNGVQVSDWVDTREADPNPRRGQRLAAGSIIIQGHDATTDLSFRSIRIAELAPRRADDPESEAGPTP